MSLPVLASLDECTSFSKTVLPFLPQLSVEHIKPLIAGKISPTEWFLSTNPFISAIMLSLVISVLCFTASEINRNYSQVDRLWSILPTLYIAHFTLFAHLKGLPTQRLDTLLTFAALWSSRLTYNYWRKGGYSIGSEDYRWITLRNNASRPLFFIFNVTFISLLQNLLLLAIAAPAYLFLLTSTLPNHLQFTTADLLFSRFLMILLLLELLADQQQWAYQCAKASYKKTSVVPPGFEKSDLDRGFLAIWLGVYQWACVVTDTMWNWTAVGAVCLLALFQGSTRLTEKISKGKYGEYEEYQKRVAMFVPGLGAFKGFTGAVVEETVVKKRE